MSNEVQKRMTPVVIEGAQIVFRNFAGEERQYNAAGNRNFGLVLPAEIAETMMADGWNVKQFKQREEDVVPDFWIPVAVSFKGKPPRISMVTSKGRTPLGLDEILVLDWVDIKYVDVIIRPYEWVVNGQTGVKAYLQSAFVIIEEDFLERKYAELPDATISHGELQDLGEKAEIKAIEAGLEEDEFVDEAPL